MRVGYYINPQTPGPHDDGRVIFEVLDQTELAERLGFSDVWLTEHAFTGYNAYSDPLMLAAAISQRTKRLKIGFSIAIAPLQHPIRFVTRANLLDRLSGGRLVVGIGPGNSPDEFRGYGRNAADRHEMFNEWVAITDKVWEAPEGGFSYSGKYWSGTVKGRIIPAPFQRPRPHMAQTTSTMETIDKIGQRGWSLLLGPHAPEVLGPRMERYRRAIGEAGLDETTRARAMEYTGALKQIYCAAPGENWHETIGEYIRTYVVKSALANSGIDDLPKEDIEQRIEGYLRNWLLAGDADELIERLTPFAKLGLSHLMCWMNFGHMPDAMIRASMMRFAANVVPVLAQSTYDAGYAARMAEASGGATVPITS